MKKSILIIFVSIFFISMTHPAYSFDLIGWWSRENKVHDTPEIMKITENRFSGIRYSVLSSDQDEIQISIANGGPTIIKKIDDNTIQVTTVNKSILKYRRITRNIDLDREDAKRLISAP